MCWLSQTIPCIKRNPKYIIVATTSNLKCQGTGRGSPIISEQVGHSPFLPNASGSSNLRQ